MFLASTIVALLLNLLLVAFIVESITYALLKADLLEKPRDFIKSKSKFLNDLLSCGYCSSFWVSLIVLGHLFLFTSHRFYLFYELNPTLNFIFCWFVVHRFGNIIHGAIDKYFDRSKDLRYRNIYTEE
jgi:hypothetical protein